MSWFLARLLCLPWRERIADRIRTIQNGINLQEDLPTRQVTRGVFNLNESVPVVEMVGRASAWAMGEAGRRRVRAAIFDLYQDSYQTTQSEAVCTVERGAHQASGPGRVDR